MVSPELPRWQRDMIRQNIEYTSEQEKLKSERERLITLTTQVQHQSRTIDNQKTIIENLTLKNEKCEDNITQLIAQIRNLRTDNTTLRKKTTETDGENFKLRQAHDSLLQEFWENVHKLHILQNNYDSLLHDFRENVQKLHILENNFPR